MNRMAIITNPILTSASTMTDASLLRLLQLSSATLPVGGYAFSHGLEWAVDAQWLSTSDDVIDWLAVQLTESVATLDLPILQRQCLALSQDDMNALIEWNRYILACRESYELRLTDTALADAMIRLLKGLSIGSDLFVSLNKTINEPHQISYVTPFAIAINHWRIPSHHAALGYVWAWLENQIAAATKLTLFGQLTAQKALDVLIPVAEDAVNQSLLISDDAIGTSLPGLAMASSHHETQYSRLFRS
ncbi:urease accessory protein UreF [Pseudomonadales bacterium]|nr:urease accessory protein UreF [Pseudomonadales bacterium]